jgi:hypothetical protein
MLLLCVHAAVPEIDARGPIVDGSVRRDPDRPFGGRRRVR